MPCPYLCKNGYQLYRILFTPLFALLSVVAYAQQPVIPAIDSNGLKLRDYYLGLDVGHLWLKGHHVDWETGMEDRDDNTDNRRTHCSMFVAQGCKRLNIYILRPPAHKFHLMANAQYDWLMGCEARRDGWAPIVNEDIIEEYRMAQEYANKGYVTIAVYKNEDAERPGHIAFVTPANITCGQLKNNGPMLTQAGHFNANSTPLRRGFENHITTWPERKIAFYYNSNKPY